MMAMCDREFRQCADEFAMPSSGSDEGKAMAMLGTRPLRWLFLASAMRGRIGLGQRREMSVFRPSGLLP